MSIELAFAAILFWKSFPHQEFVIGKTRHHIVSGVGKVLSVKDVIDDAKYIFANEDLEYGSHDDVWDF